MTYRNGISADLVMPIRGVTAMFSTLNPSSITWRSERGETMSFSLSRGRVMPRASQSFPGPLAILRRSRAEARSRSARPRALAISLDAADRLQRAKQHASSIARRQAGNIQAVVDAIDKVNIGVTRRSKQHGVARGLSCGSVRSQIARAEIRFHFNDASRKLLTALFRRTMSLPSSSRATSADRD